MQYMGRSLTLAVVLVSAFLIAGCSSGDGADFSGRDLDQSSDTSAGAASSQGSQDGAAASGDNSVSGDATAATDNDGSATTADDTGSADSDDSMTSGGSGGSASPGDTSSSGDAGGASDPTGTSDDTGSSDGTGDAGSGQAAMLCAADAPATARKRTQKDAVTQSTDVDGNTIDVHMSLFQPELAEGECAPIIIKSHGYGGSRIKSLSAIGDDAAVTAVATRNAWRDGYFVVTFDQRGFGQTGGMVRVEDPGHEGHDIQAVLDYAVDHFGGHVAMRNGDPLVGALGQSYGGGFQLLGAAVDPRFDAIVPTATWYSLPFSLDANDVPKTYWLTLLFSLGASGSNGNQATFIKQGFTEAATTGMVQDSVVRELRGNGFNAYCEGLDSLLPAGGGVPRVSAFFVQGAADTLFNMNNALDNAQCLREAGNDVRVLIERTGHILPVFQSKNDSVGFAVDREVTCGDRTYNTAERMDSFLDEKLRGMQPQRPIDRNCIVQNDDHGIVTQQFPIGGEPYDVPQKQFTTGPAGEKARQFATSILTDQQVLATVADSTGQTVANLSASINRFLASSASGSPDFSGFLTSGLLMAVPPRLLRTLTNAKLEIPLFTADRDMTLAGVPTADLTLGAVGEATGATDPIVFVGLGLERAGSNESPQLIDQQLAPLRGAREYDQRLVGVSKQLHAGDQVDLLVYGFHEQYYNSFNRVPEVVTLQGGVNLPLNDR